MAEILAGFACADITPPLGASMAGHFKDRRAKLIHDPLLATAAVFRTAESACCLISCDLLNVTAALTEQVREQVSAATGIAPEAILVCATHTHSGPEVRPERGGTNEAYLSWLAGKIATAAILADQRIVPVGLLYGADWEADISFNRRYLMRDGSVRFNPGKGNPDVLCPVGPIDPEVSCVWAWHGQRPVGAVVNFACHWDVLGANNEEISAEGPGYVRRTLSAAVGTDLPVVFLNGACGDINHIDVFSPRPQRGHEHAERMGRAIAAAALRGLSSAAALEAEAILAAAKTVNIPAKRYSAEEIAWAREFLTGPRALEPSLDRVRALNIVQMAGKEAVAAELQLLRIGEWAIAGVPGELFCGIGLKIKRLLGPRSMIAELANDWVGYIPTAKAFDEGDYEVAVARVGPEAEEVIVREFSEMAASLSPA